MKATVIVRLKRMRDNVVRRKAIREFDGFWIDGQVAWESASAPARLPNNFNGLHEIYITPTLFFPPTQGFIPTVPLQNTAYLVAILSIWSFRGLNSTAVLKMAMRELLNGIELSSSFAAGMFS